MSEVASEHEHVFDDRWRCAICDEPARRVLYQLEQQLVETQAYAQQLARKNEAFALERVQLRADLAQLRDERDTLLADLRQRQAGQTSAEQRLAQVREQLRKEQSQHQIAYTENVRFLKRETYLRAQLAEALHLLEQFADAYEVQRYPVTANELQQSARALLEKQKEAADGK